jgi:hypothetical protein
MRYNVLPIISNMYIIVLKIFYNGSRIHGCLEKNNCISGVAGIEHAAVWILGAPNLAFGWRSAPEEKNVFPRWIETSCKIGFHSFQLFTECAIEIIQSTTVADKLSPPVLPPWVFSFGTWQEHPQRLGNAGKPAFRVYWRLARADQPKIQYLPFWAPKFWRSPLTIS